jgi:hypothetical protein
MLSIKSVRPVHIFPALFFLLCAASAYAQVGAGGDIRKLTFDGVLDEKRLSLKELGAAIPADWSGYSHLVVEMRTSSPQRMSIWIYTADGHRRIGFQPLGQNAWLRASIPLAYFRGRDQSGTDLASANNRRTTSFWVSIWGPFGELNAVEAVGISMDYPINKPTVELRNVHLAKQDEGSQFLETQALRDEFGQWALVDWPRKIKSREQLQKELDEEQSHFGTAADFGYSELGGYIETHAKATGFFHVEQVDGKWWFVEPQGHLYLSIGVNGAGTGFNGGFPGRGGRGRAGAITATQPANAGGRGAAPPAAAELLTHRLISWGMTTGGAGRPSTTMLRWNQPRQSTFLGVSDVYSDEFARGIDDSARNQCEPRRDDPLLIGYFVGNEPPWGGRESEVVDMILAGPDSATKTRLKEFLAQPGGDTPGRRQEFVIAAFEKYLALICAAVRKYDPNHLTLGIRFGGKPADEVLRTARVFDVCSINGYEYEPTRLIQRAYRVTGRPVLIGEFHIGVPENGLGAGLVQAKDQTQRAIGYRYYVEQAESIDACVGVHWFQWNDEPVLGRNDGENYNIGWVDVTNRPYPELVEGAKATHKRLLDVHSGKILPFAQKPMASDAGAPASPWDNRW